MAKEKTKETVSWDDRFFLRSYQLAKSGLNDSQIAEALGIPANSFKVYKKRRPALKEAVEEARADLKRSGTFFEGVYHKLPPALQPLWNQIMDLDKHDITSGHVIRLMGDQSDNVRKHIFLYALVHCNFNASKAASMTGMRLGEIKKWQRDPAFAELYDELKVHKGNFFEEGLMKLVHEGNASAIIFANRSYNRDRGYNDKQEVHHTHRLESNQLNLEDLDLEPDVLEKVLIAIQKKQAITDHSDFANPLPRLPDPNVIEGRIHLPDDDSGVFDKEVKNANNRPRGRWFQSVEEEVSPEIDAIAAIDAQIMEPDEDLQF